MALKLSNNASSLLAANINDSVTTIAITSGDEGKFPVLGVGDWCPLTVFDGSGNRENMKCTARSGVTLTVERGQEGSTAASFLAGARVDVRLTNAAFEAGTTDADRLATGEVASAVLPARLRDLAGLVDDADDITKTGFYQADASTLNTPLALVAMIWHMGIDANTAYQEYQPASTTARYARRMAAATWGAWYLSYMPHAEVVERTPVGGIIDYGGSTAPTGWLLCYGQEVSRTGESALFDVIGTTFGAGNGSTTFNVPDYRGRVGAGQDDMGGTSANRLTNQSGGLNGDTLGATGGSETHTLTLAQIPAHDHGGSTGSGGAHSHTVENTLAGSDVTTAVWESGNSGSRTTTTSTAAAHVHSIPSAGSGQAHNNVQPTIIVNKIIKT
ncbi:tail fiber protein [Allomesorhizobium alhagi]|uniref:Microcystin-dependent protein-like protein n=1 Tax=Mesorhizobium alhagi CCNWXJ12-2 TaxID=1107882 RepID=H0HNH5_9HYPH|nr:tail fiber protein [Mesorhizobium alhagi]EHK57747.1 microcystin-dependent protein-like protein [Mesorhizobium alhagi CCNWXJ12-2]